MLKIINYCKSCKSCKITRPNRYYYPCCSEDCFELYRNELIEIKCSRWCLEHFISNVKLFLFAVEKMQIIMNILARDAISVFYYKINAIAVVQQMNQLVAIMGIVILVKLLIKNKFSKKCF
jgi:hypothetical protein